MFDALVARSQSVIATVELFVPLPEQAFACAAMSRLSVRHPSNAVGGLTYLSGPEGSGKSFLARNAIREARRQQPKLVFAIAGAYDLAEALVRVDQSRKEAANRFSLVTPSAKRDGSNRNWSLPLPVPMTLLKHWSGSINHKAWPICWNNSRG